jgi:hypothetical protein
MPWTPDAVVKINGTAVTNYTLEGVSISMGRETIDQQSQAGYARISFKDYPQTSVAINDTIVVQIKNYSGTLVTIYTGYVTDVQASVLDAGGTNLVYVTDIICTGALSKLANKDVNSTGYSEEQDGTRMLKVVTEAFGTKWSQLPTTQIWTDYTTETWNDLLGVTTTYIDTPGTYTLYAATAELTNGYDYASVVADSGQGQLYERTDGNLGYSDQDARSTYVTANGFTNIPKNHILADGIAVLTSRNNLINDAIISYGNPAATSETIDATSIDLYGKIAATTTTYLKNSSDADTYGARQVLLNAYPNPVISGIGIQIDAPTMSSTLLNSLVNVFFGMPISMTDIPSLLYPTDFFGYVEGWNWTINRFTARLDLNVSDFAYSAVPVAWEDVYISETWDTLDPDLKWQDALLGVN